MRLEGFSLADILLESTLDMRYTGQAYELSIPFEPDYKEAFHRAHRKVYGYANPQRATEIVQMRVKGIGRTEKPMLTTAHQAFEPHAPEFRQRCARVYLQGEVHATPVFRREELAAGARAERAGACAYGAVDECDSGVGVAGCGGRGGTSTTRRERSSCDN